MIWVLTSQYSFCPPMVCSQSFIRASGQRPRFSESTCRSDHRCDDITALWKTSHSHLHAAWIRSLARYQWWLWRFGWLNGRGWQKSRRFLLFLPPPGFFGGTSGKLGKAFTAFISYFSTSLISFISGLSWISPSCSRRNLANTNPGAGLVSRVSVSERGHLSSTPIMSFSPCFKKRKDSCSFCHPTISLSRWAAKIQVWD